MQKLKGAIEEYIGPVAFGLMIGLIFMWGA